MVVMLKLIGFGIWFVIMLFIITGSRKKSIPQVREVMLQLEEGEDIEMSIHLALGNLCRRDRLVIKDGTTSNRSMMIINRILQKNPSILHIAAEQYCL